jgi:DNA-binding MarR family transcriptional regulator
MRDVVKELGFLTLGTRLKRVGESIQAQAQEVLAIKGFDLPAAHFPLLAALDRLGPLGVSELSLAVGVSQPVVSRSLLGLEANGLVESKSVATDRRLRSVRLSRKGRALVQRAKQAVWPLIEAAVEQACKPLSGTLLEQLAALELALDTAPLARRVGGAAAMPSAAARRSPT